MMSHGIWRKTSNCTLVLFLFLCFGLTLPFSVAKASTGGHTQAEAVAWARQQVGTPFGECPIFVAHYYQYLGQAWPTCDYAADFLNGSSVYVPAGWSYQTSPQPGDICVWDRYVWANSGWETGYAGHIGVVIEVKGSNILTVESNINGANAEYSNPENRPISGVTKFIRPDFSKEEEIRGSEMSQGFDRAIPDGDYIIATAGSSDKSTFYYLDIQGDAYPAASESNVALYGPVSEDPPVYDVWTITYNSSDKFYTIKQKGTDQCLDVYWADTKQGANIQVCISNNGSAQKWAIERNGSNGFRLRPKCSGGGNGMCLDISGGIFSGGTNIQQWAINNSDAQSWLFIPYKPSQPITDGRYILLYAPNQSFELDVLGDTGIVENNTNVQLWADTAPSEFNSVNFIALSNGYYKIQHAASGKCLDVTGGSAAYKSNVAIHDDNGSIAQQWAIISNGSGYSLVSRCNGYALDLPDGATGNGKNVEVYPRLNNNNQRWTFVHAEYSVRYHVPEGENQPDDQVKYYKTDLAVSSQIPSRSGYEFVCWEDILSLDENMNTNKYLPGQVITTDESLALYPVWEANDTECTILFDSNGGSGEIQPVKVQKGATYTLPACSFTAPEGQTFDQWDKGAVGAQITVNGDITFTAQWKYNDVPPEIVTEQFSAPSVWPVNSVVEVRLNYENATNYMYNIAYPSGGSNGGTFSFQTVDGVTIGYIDAGDHRNGQKATFGIAAFIDGQWTAYTEIQITFFSHGKLPTPVISFPNQGDTINIGTPLNVEITGCDAATEYHVAWPKENSDGSYLVAYIQTPQMIIAEDYFYTPGTYRIQVVASAVGWQLSDMASKLINVEGIRPAGPTIICNEERIVKHSPCSFTLTKENATEFEYCFEYYQAPQSIQAENGTVTINVSTPLYSDETHFTFQARAKVNNMWTEYSTLECIVYDKPTETGLVSISFLPNGGAGYMENAEVVSGNEYSLPACGFTAPEGKVFDQWDKGPVGAQITVNGDITLTAQWKDADAQPDAVYKCWNGQCWWRMQNGVLTIYANGPASAVSKAWDRNSVTGVVVLNGVASLPDRAFDNCANLKSAHLSESVLDIGAFCFSNCSNLSSVTLPSRMNSLGQGAFWYCASLEEAFVPEGVSVINYELFYGCASLKVLHLPSTLTEIPGGPFTQTILTDVYYNGSEAAWNQIEIDRRYNDPLFSAVIHFLGGTNPSIVQSGSCGRNLTWTLDNDGLLTISGTGPMYDYSSDNPKPWGFAINNVKINPGVTSIGNNAFKYCDITGATIADSVTSIGDFAFTGCTSLTSITIPDSVTNIGRYAFAESGLISVNIPNGITTIADHLFFNCTGLASVMIPNSITSIGDSAFNCCVNLNSIVIPNSVISIGNGAFFRCASLSSITIPDSVTNIGSSAFGNCTSLTSIMIPDSVTSIGSAAFAACHHLTEITIPNSITCINSDLFHECISLTSITLPDSVTSIGDFAFLDCFNLVDVYYGGTAEQWNAVTVGSNNELLRNANIHLNTSSFVSSGALGENLTWTLDTTGLLTISGVGEMMDCDGPIAAHPFYAIRSEVHGVVIENGVTSIGANAFKGMSHLASVEIAESVTSILQFAFEDCEQLTDITLPDAVTYIGWYAFYECTALTSINIPANIREIDDSAFEGCGNLKHLALLDGIPTKEFVRCYDGNACDLYSYTLPASLEMLGRLAFARTEAGDLLLHVSPDFVLPRSLQTIEAEAFSGINATCVLIDGQMAIESRAFAGCKQLKYVVFADYGAWGYDVTLADDAFDGCTNLIIFATPGYSNGAVEQFAIDHGFQYYVIEGYYGNG